MSELLTVVVPTYNERDNVAPLVARLEGALAGVPARVLVVDDSSDDTAEEVRRVAATSSLPVAVLHRPAGQRTGGLGGAVLTGLQEAGTPYVAVMDGDLQHPPEVVPQLLERARAEAADVVVASRYVPGGSQEGLAGAWRRFVSSGATRLARTAFPVRLRGCSDPMSGFFLVRREALQPQILRPDGFKILLEVLARHAGLRIAEVPFTFAERGAGDSKAGLSQGLVYLRHLARLRLGGGVARLAGFLLVGASGILPNLLTTAALVALGVHYLVAAAAATLVAATWNFALAETTVFRHRGRGAPARRWLGYLALGAADIALRVPVVALLVEVAGLGVLAASVVSIGMASLARFLVLDRWVYAPGTASPIPRQRQAPEAGAPGRTTPDRTTSGSHPMSLEGLHDVA